MKIEDVRRTAYSMRSPTRLSARAVSLLRSRIHDHTYRTDMDALRAVVPSRSKFMSRGEVRVSSACGLDGFGDYTETGQVIPVKFNGVEGGYVHSMYRTDEARCGRPELWGFPKKYATPRWRWGKTFWSAAFITAKPLCRSLHGLQARLGIMRRSEVAQGAELHDQDHPHVDATPRICELVRYYLKTSR